MPLPRIPARYPQCPIRPSSLFVRGPASPARSDSLSLSPWLAADRRVPPSLSPPGSGYVRRPPDRPESGGRSPIERVRGPRSSNRGPLPPLTVSISGVAAPRIMMKSPVFWLLTSEPSLRSIAISPVNPPETSASRLEILPRNMMRTPSNVDFSLNWDLEIPPTPSQTTSTVTSAEPRSSHARSSDSKLPVQVWPDRTRSVSTEADRSFLSMAN